MKALNREPLHDSDRGLKCPHHLAGLILPLCRDDSQFPLKSVGNEPAAQF